ncbi:hypothetical protein [Candidatus Thiosymbion oneisti]|uniref:hypothetical protein n=1 Tax=Candidatus Thiosymbion oneisti TaxID=589554 RepID=UPI00105B9ABB|nr:hypothetical protein [Candidatus Thiosymbion oneisti]
MTHDGAEPADRWTDFEQRVEHARELIVLYGQVDPKWVRSRIERACCSRYPGRWWNPTLETI